MLTVRDDDTDVLAGLEAGADDYVAKDSAGAIVLARVRRLIQFRQMSSMAMLNQQLVQVGRLLAGIVHEIRGPLAVIRGSAELLAYTDSPESENHQWIDAILRNSQLLQLRLDHLMATVRNSSSHAQDIELSPLVLREAVQLFMKGLPPGVGRSRSRSPATTRVPSVRIDPGRLMQVLFNILGNAQQALARLGPARPHRGACRHGRRPGARVGRCGHRATMGRECPRFTSIESSSPFSRPATTGPVTGCIWRPSS